MLVALRNWAADANRETGAAAARALIEIVERRGAELDEAALDLIADALARVLLDVAEDMRPSLSERMRAARADAHRKDAGAETSAASAAEAILQARLRYASPADLLALAGEPGLRPSLTHLLITVGGEAVWRRLAENSNARLSSASFSLLAELAISRLALKRALARRDDLPETAAERLAPFLSEADRAVVERDR